MWRRFMFDIENPRTFFAKNSSKLFSICIALLILLFPFTALAENSPCQNASVHLRGDLDTIMARGGVWTLMEQNQELKEKSMLGFQVDGKLSRTVGSFETLCETGKNPTKQLFTAIQNILGEARTAFNPSSSGDKLLEQVNVLNKNLDTLLAKIE
jgi:hypothetical protein